MILHMLKSKIHCATVTEANLQYMGSITIDRDLMDAAGILENERVQVVDNNNGARLETYVIPGERGSGVICLNGAAARLAQPGDIVIIMAYAFFTGDEARTYRPTVVMVDAQNKVKEIRHLEHHGERG
ncbi:MAG: aspartate 1-decarboxylase [Selenomonas sp.]|jgi:aspartate 1-decarboxylase|nr:aspartate 1-decarboxylase [Selenomonas sp.]MCI7331734.1 aspartate 1-decarboxylase [Selenomonadaceae bacterium]MDD6120244.1 aspartate 1-decarboxylase [Selenomonadaceae bacterium]MDD7056934.1 aspartate 1-decarboxylase [Selenomonadaceae bacterium]MDY3915201.1 aspartate 1-decarboxylase [Selenomonadaceae bacterium]